jgi:hypothetical protein
MPLNLVRDLYGSPFPQLRAADDLDPQQFSGYQNKQAQDQAAQY